jgi:hypothetical protein
MNRISGKFQLVTFGLYFCFILSGCKSQLYPLVPAASLQDITPITIKYGKKDSVVKQVTLKINLKKSDTLFLKDYGYVSGLQVVKFISGSQNAILCKDMNGSQVYQTSIESLKESLGTAAAEYPDPGDTGSNSSDYLLSDFKMFDEKLQGVIIKYFTLPGHPLNSGIPVTKVTPYRNLSVSEPNLHGQVSIFISYPYILNNKKYFRVAYEAREKNTLSAYRSAGDLVNQAAVKFVGQFVNDLMK